MIKIFTPENWHYKIDAPSIIIDDDGFIYKELEYYKAWRQPCGKIDYSSGYIYGDDYSSFMPTPIGAVKKANGYTEIYGTDFAQFSACPIYYIKGDTVYSAEEFFKVFKSSMGYVEGTIGQNNQVALSHVQEKEAYVGNNSEAAEAFSQLIHNIISWIGTIILVIGLLVLSAVLLQEQFTGAENLSYLIAFVSALVVGCISAFRNPWSDVTSFQMIFWMSTIAFSVYLFVRMIVEEGFGLKVIGFGVLGFFFTMLLCLLPALILGFIVGVIRICVEGKGNKKEKQSKESAE